MAIYSRAAQEILDALEDKVASLKAAGKIREAAEAERELARQTKSQMGGSEMGAFSVPRTQRPPDEIPATPERQTFATEGNIGTSKEAMPTSATLSADELLDARAKARMENRPITEVVSEIEKQKSASRPYSGELDTSTFQRPSMEEGLPTSPVDFTAPLPAPVERKFPGMEPAATEGFKVGDQNKDASGLKRAAQIAAGTGVAGVGAAALLRDSPKAPEPKPTLMAEAKPTDKKPPPDAAEQPEAARPARGTLPYRAVRNYLESLDKPPTFDAGDIAQGLDRNQAAVQARASGIKKEIDGLMAMHNVARDTLAKQELAEKIVGAIGLMAAGAVGMNTGKDLSGVKFNQTDWKTKADAAQRDLTNSLAAAKEKYGVDEDVLNKERQRLMESKQERNAQYEMAYRNWAKRGDELKYKTDYEQQERGYQDSLARWNAEMADRAERQAAAGRDPVEALAKERETEQDKLVSDWSKKAAMLPKLKDSNDKEAAAEELRFMNQQIKDLRGYGMIRDNDDIFDDIQRWNGADWQELARRSATHQKEIANMARTNPAAGQLLKNSGTYIRQFTQDLMQSEGLTLRDADRAARANFQRYLQSTQTKK